jgi:hypothetical protein
MFALVRAHSGHMHLLPIIGGLDRRRAYARERRGFVPIWQYPSLDFWQHVSFNVFPGIED